jgi:hypothetical protein
MATFEGAMHMGVIGRTVSDTFVVSNCDLNVEVGGALLVFEIRHG